LSIRSRSCCPPSRAEVPAGIDIDILYDRSVSIRNSVEDVQFTLLLALVLVVLVIFVFLPIFQRPSFQPCPALSVIGTFALMYLLGYSLDNISLMR